MPTAVLRPTGKYSPMFRGAIRINSPSKASSCEGNIQKPLNGIVTTPQKDTGIKRQSGCKPEKSFHEMPGVFHKKWF
ncbi:MULTISPECIES: hypothetical protein [Rhizobium/Agrobacterium group]|uniref:Uncharacterized protein n=1 Tax=Agrobacterium cucumeris TaxID=2862866 RepID=A0ABY8RVE3_9HYPH|nr:MULTISPECIES: hypothetical protein [Rhizobium/Agrobacterium group]MCZ7469413.1 hypothetical protein [Rhizobium rhizogenes]MCZ7483575.1 hypothetical protein [Rhizobium rhizogenes]WHO11625.1 hypothetical protein KZ699_15390 [Agrobacterium cucumeris]